MMFNLSKGILRQIIERKSVNGQARSITFSNTTESKSLLNLSSNSKPVIVEITDMSYFEDEKIVGINMFDGETTVNAVLDTNKWLDLDDEFIKKNQIDLTIQHQKMCDHTENKLSNSIKFSIGTIILMLQYSFNDVEVVEENNIINDVLLLIDYYIIGAKTPEKKNEFVSNSTEHNTFIQTHSISMLSEDIKHSKWTIKAILTKRTSVREFTNQFTSAYGKLIRIQLKDITGCIEAFAFNADIKNLPELELGKLYYVSGLGGLKKSKVTRIAWQEDNPVKIEIAITNSTVFSEINEFNECGEENITKSTPNSQFALNDMLKATIFDNHNNFENFKEKCENFDSNDYELNFKSKRIKSDDQQESFYQNKKNSNLIPIEKLFFQEEGSSLNIIAIISNVSQTCKNIKPRSSNFEIALRNFKIIDESKKEIPVALWGKQATDFKLKVGTVIMLTNCKLTNFNGVSLSIQRETGLLEILPEFEIEYAEKLRNWYSLNLN